MSSATKTYILRYFKKSHKLISPHSVHIQHMSMSEQTTEVLPSRQRKGYPLLTFATHLDGGIAACFEGIWIIKIYAPSQAGKRRKRKAFYNTDMIIILPSAPTEILLARDFNCVLSHADSTGQGNFSRTLKNLVHGFSLKDVCDSHSLRPNYTHYTSPGASRLDRVYTTDRPPMSKQGVETLAAAFTCHSAVIERLSLESEYRTWPGILEDEHITVTRDRFPAQITGGVGGMENARKIPPQPSSEVGPPHEAHDTPHLST